MRTGTVEPELYADTLGNIEPGDLQQGVGISTSQLGRVGISRADTDRSQSHAVTDAAGKTGLQNVGEAITGQKDHGTSLMVVGVFILLLALVKYVTEKAGDKGEFASVRVGFENLFIIGTMASLWIYGEKIAVALLPWNNAFVRALKEFVGIV